MKLPLRESVEQWIAEHQIEITASQLRKHSAQNAVHAKRASTRVEIAKLVRRLKLEPIAGRASVRKEAAEFFLERYNDFTGEVTEKGLCSYIRHNYTNYEDTLAIAKGDVRASDLYVNMKVYLCCGIIAHYGLDVNPLLAQYQDLSRSETGRTLSIEGYQLCR